MCFILYSYRQICLAFISLYSVSLQTHIRNINLYLCVLTNTYSLFVPYSQWVFLTQTYLQLEYVSVSLGRWLPTEFQPPWLASLLVHMSSTKINLVFHFFYPEPENLLDNPTGTLHMSSSKINLVLWCITLRIGLVLCTGHLGLWIVSFSLILLTCTYITCSKPICGSI